MEHQQIINLLNGASDSKFVTRKWNIANDQPNTNYDVGNQDIYNVDVFKSICYYIRAYILVIGVWQEMNKCMTKNEYSLNYSIDEVNNFDADITNANAFTSFEFQVKLLETKLQMERIESEQTQPLLCH